MAQAQWSSGICTYKSQNPVATHMKGTLDSGHAMGTVTLHLGIIPRLSQAAKNSGSGQGLGGGPGSYGHTTTANKVETLKEEEEELKRKVEQCKVRGHLRFPGWVGVAGWALFSFHR